MATALGRALAARGHAIYYISYEKPVRTGLPHENISYHQVPTKPYPLFAHLPYETNLTSKIVEICRKYPVDLVHVHYAIPHASAAYLAREIIRTYDKRYIPFIVTLHGTDITWVGQDASYKPVVDFSIGAADAITAVSVSLKNETCAHFRITHEEVLVIPNFVLSTGPRRAVAAPENDEKVIVHVSNFRQVKRTQDVVEIFRGIQETVPAQLFMIGDGPEIKETMGLCATYGLTEKVRFLGHTEAVEDILHRADLFLLPSQKESFGLAALEAMACGTPVVASRVGGLPEVVEEGISGFLCAVGDIPDMIQKSLRVLGKKEQEKFSKAARQRALHFSPERSISAYEALYQAVRAKATERKVL